MDVRRMASYRLKPTGNNSSSVASLRKLTGKKASLLELINSGKKYTTEEKVKILDTSKSNVYKLTSELKKEGFISKGTNEGLRGNASDGITMFLDSIHNEGQKPAVEKNQLIDSSTRKQTPSSSESKRTQAFKLFRKGVKDVEIAIRLDISQEELFSYKRQFLRLTGSDSLCMAYEEIEESEFEFMLDLIAKRKAQQISWEKFLQIVERVPRLEYFDLNYDIRKRELERVEQKVREKEQTLQDLDRKISEAHDIYEDKNAFNNKLAGRIVEKQNQIKKLDEAKDRKKRFIAFLEQTPLYLDIKQFVEQKVKEMISNPERVTELTIDTMLDLIKEKPADSVMTNYVFNAPVVDREPEFRKRVHASIQSKLEQRLKRRLLNAAENKPMSSPPAGNLLDDSRSSNHN